MAKARVKNIKSVLNSVRKVFKDTQTSKKVLDDISDFSINRIKQETRKGIDLVNDDRQPDLSDSYKRYRRRLKSGKANSKVTPASFMRPGLSHLTLTGELLDSLKSKIIRSRGILEIFPTGSRSDGLTNQEVTKELKEQGRVYLGLNKKAIEEIRKIFVDELRRNIKKFEQK